MSMVGSCRPPAAEAAPSISDTLFSSPPGLPPLVDGVLGVALGGCVRHEPTADRRAVALRLARDRLGDGRPGVTGGRGVRDEPPVGCRPVDLCHDSLTFLPAPPD